MVGGWERWAGVVWCGWWGANRRRRVRKAAQSGAMNHAIGIFSVVLPGRHAFATGGA